MSTPSLNPEDLPDAWARIDAEGRLVVINERARWLFASLSLVEAPVRWADVISTEEAARFARLVSGLPVGATAVQEFDFGTRPRLVRFRVNVLRLEEGFSCTLQQGPGPRAVPPLFVGQAEVWLPADFLSRLTHGLRTHVATAQAAAFVLGSNGQNLAGPKERKWMGAIRDSLGGLGGMLDQIDALDRTICDDRGRGPEPINVSAWLAMVVERTRKVAPDSTVSLEIGPCVGGRWWFGDFLLGTILECLLSNALKFAPADGRASIRIVEADKGLEILVADNGPGVTEVEAESLFKPFFRARNAHALPGCGLGLAIARAAATSLGGSVTYRHRTGTGTEFRVVVPARAER